MENSRISTLINYRCKSLPKMCAFTQYFQCVINKQDMILSPFPPPFIHLVICLIGGIVNRCFELLLPNVHLNEALKCRRRGRNAYHYMIGKVIDSLACVSDCLDKRYHQGKGSAKSVLFSFEFPIWSYTGAHCLVHTPTIETKDQVHNPLR